MASVIRVSWKELKKSHCHSYNAVNIQSRIKIEQVPFLEISLDQWLFSLCIFCKTTFGTKFCFLSLCPITTRWILFCISYSTVMSSYKLHVISGLEVILAIYQFHQSTWNLIQHLLAKSSLLATEVHCFFCHLQSQHPSLKLWEY